MKKFLIALAVAAVAATGLFAQEGVIEGNWYDKAYNCNWVFTPKTGDGTFLELRDAPTNSLIFRFTTSNIQNFKQDIDNTAGLTITFDCEEKNRSYKFTKPISGTPDLRMEIYNHKFNENHHSPIILNGWAAKQANGI